MKIAKAVKKLTEAISKDPDFRMGYQANIAMAFVDECSKIKSFENTPYDILIQTSNDAANRSLTNWCRGI